MRASCTPAGEALDHPVRARLLDHVKASPGATLRELAEALPVSRSTVRHHVRVLVQGDLLRDERLGRARIVYRPGARERARRAHLARHPVRARLLERLDEGPARLTALAEAAGTSPGNALHHLRRLREAGAAAAREDGRWQASGPVEEAEAAPAG